MDGRDLSRRAVVLLLGAAVLLKITYLLDYAQALPFLSGPIFDSQVYLAQAAAVRSGRFSDATLLAFSPLYGYFLAALRSPLFAVLAQLALGVGNLVLLYRLCKPLFGPTAALLSATLCAGYGALLCNESKILSETLGFSLGLLTLALYLSAGFRAGRVVLGVAAGAALGLAILARASLLFCFPFFGACAFLPWGRAEQALGRAGWLVRFKRSAALGLGLALVLGGNGLWNYAHSGFFVPVIFVSSTVAKTTGKEWKGELADLNKTGDKQADAEASAGPWDVVYQAQDRLSGKVKPGDAPKARIDFGGWLRGAPRKLATTLLDIEISSFMYSYYGERSEIPVLWILPVSFGMLLLLGIAGAVVLARRDGILALCPYLPFLLGPLVTCTLYHPSSRYRLAMVLPALVLAGLGALTLARLGPRLRWLQALVLLALVVMLYRNQAYKLQNEGMWHAMVARSAVLTGELDVARARVKRAYQVAPAKDNEALDRYLRGIGLPELEPRPRKLKSWDRP